MTIIEQLAADFGSLRHEEVPEPVRAAARHSVLDWTGCAIAGQDEPLAGMLREELASPDGRSSLIGRRAQTSAMAAALINGAAGHALDFDDTNLTMRGHPTVPVLPAVLALGEELGASGRDIVTALVVGTEVAVRVAHVLGGSHYERGWHTTGTCGVVGAAAACSRLLAADEAQTATALALAVTQAGGLKASFGTMAKPLHAGRAAADGLFAARLAARGFSANPGIIEAAQGLGVATLDDGAKLAALDDVAGRWFTSETHFKLHAACFGTHGAINSALEVIAQLRSAGASPDDIREVAIVVPPSLLDVCAIESPATGLQGKFSLRAATALTLLGESTADLSQYSDERMASPDLIEMRDRIRVVADGAQDPSVTTLRVVTTSGELREVSHDTSVRRHGLDAEWEMLVEKFRALVDPRLGSEGAGQLVACVHGFEDLGSLGPFVEMTRASEALATR